MTVSTIAFWVNDRRIEVPGHIPATTTLLRYLRETLHLTGTKEGCAEGDCGACTVIILENHSGVAPSFRAVNACLLFLPMVQGRRVYTVEGLRDRGSALHEPESGFHPAQQAMVEHRASQCGYCTPGIVMSLFEACYRDDMGDPLEADDQVAGNLCRCTGYRPIREAAREVAGLQPEDRFRDLLRTAQPESAVLDREAAGQVYIQPATLDALWTARAHHPQAVLVAGGTDLALRVTKEHRFFPEIIGLEAIDSLKVLERWEGGWFVGGGVTLTRLQERVGPTLPVLARMLRYFGARQIRSRATVGGNLCNASPIGDLAPVFLALGATVTLGGSAGARELPLDAFFLGYRKTALVGDEILLGVFLPDPPAGSFCTSYKVSKRRELDISAVSAAMSLSLDGEGRVAALRLAYGGVAATPVRARHAEGALMGLPWTAESVERAAMALDRDFTPISDLRGSAAYRALLARNLLTRFHLDSLSASVPPQSA